MSQNKLTGADVVKLLQDPSPENRVTAAEKVSAQFAGGDLNDNERAIAEDIFRSMVKDAEVRVRKALAESLKNNPEIPHDVAVNLARDVSEVALPIIECSDVLSDEDLVEIVKTKSAEHQIAVARRPFVSEQVSDVLVDTRNVDVVATLVGNDGAFIAEKTMGRVLDEFGDNEKVNAPLARRKELPINIAERLVSLVTENLKEYILTNHEVSADTAMDLVISSRERATISLLSPNAKSTDVRALVDQLYRNNRLTPSLIVRALCMGDTTFFETALAKLAGIPIVNAYILVHDEGGLGLEKLFTKCDITDSLLPIARAALSVANEMTVYSGDDREKFRRAMIERVLTQMEDDIDADNLDYFIGKISAQTNNVAA